VAKEKYGFTDFKILDDTEATKKNIIASLEWAFTNNKPDDKLVIFYSGHGTYWPCNAETIKYESDGFDECLVPVDYDVAGLIIDDDLNSFIMGAPDKMSIVFICDCCFSGHLLRDVSNPLPKNIKNKFLPPPLSLVLSCGDVDLNEELRPDISHSYKGNKYLKPFMWDTRIQNDAILISGCGEHQVSADIFIPSLKRYHGAMTYTLFHILAEHGWKMTYEDLITEVNNTLGKEEFDQKPQLECKKELMTNYFLGD